MVKGVLAGVRGPHTGEALPNGAEVILHCSRSNLEAATIAGEGASSDSMSEDLEDGDLV